MNWHDGATFPWCFWGEGICRITSLLYTNSISIKDLSLSPEKTPASLPGHPTALRGFIERYERIFSSKWAQ